MSKQNQVQHKQETDQAQAKPANPKTQPLVTAVSHPTSLLQKATLSPQEARTLQRAIGNQALGRLTIQRKMTLAPVGDKYEQEADAVARQVVGSLSSNGSEGKTAVQRTEEEEEIQAKLLPTISTLQRQEEEEDVQMKPFRPVLPHLPFLQQQEEDEEVQAKGNPMLAGGELSGGVETAVSSAKSGGSPIANAVRKPMEQAFGADFSGVKIHADTQADSLNQSLQARAFTTGKDIFFRQGEYNPASYGGQELLAHELTHVVQQGSAGVQRQTPDTICRCPACSGGKDDDQIQTKPVAHVQQQGNGHHHGCGCSTCAPVQQQTNSPAVMRHHDEEIVQAKKMRTSTSGQTTAQTTAVSVRQTVSPAAVIQRHAAFEHYLLGQVAPSKLDGIPMVRELPELQQEYDRLLEMKTKHQVEPVKLPEIEAKIIAAQARINEVKHTIEQEMDRLEQWKDDPEAMSNRTGEKGKVTKGQDDTWNVPIIVLPCQDGEIVVSYSEMNTMPDLFGSPEAIADTPKSSVLGLLQGVRQQSYIELDNLYQDIFGKSRSVLTVNYGIDKDFKDALGPRAQATINKAYEIRTEKQVNTATTRPGEEHEQYFAALERNACHFAPESWSQWEGYHQQARIFAHEAALSRQEAERLRQQGDNEGAEALENRAAKAANDALLQNSFGEHYLQDSFASGHLIDKTKIMQWFMTWLNNNDDGLGSFDKAKAEWSMISTLSDQDLQSNPQQLHDKMRRSQLGSVEDATTELNLEAKPEIVFLMWWRDAASKNSDLKDLNATTAAANFDLRGQKKLASNKMKAQQILKKLANQGFADRGRLNAFRSEPLYTIKKIQIDALKGKGAYDANLAMEMQQSEKEHGTERDFVKEAHEFNLAAYNAFLSNAYVQAATKYFHDIFCKQGLTVKSRNGDEIGKIYGDNNMLNAGGQTGVKYSAETSAMSRETIFTMINQPDANVPSVGNISGRFPGNVVVKGATVSLVNWNENLKAQGENGLFKKAKDNGALMVYKVQGGISDKGALDMAQLTQTIGAFTPHDETPF
ncbi:MAG: DUF4157 domain-containing protein [Aquificales bacterium]|nr:DUF4157 domain-containing protein [Aquificales bacterium]